MSDLREKILSELWAYKDAPDTQFGIDTTDRIIALVREALLSEESLIEASVPVARAAQFGHTNEAEYKGLLVAEVAIKASLAAAGLGGQGE